jgi:hypothetical protein
MSLNAELESLKARVAYLEAKVFSQEKETPFQTPAQNRFGNLWNSALVFGVGCAALAGSLGGMPWAMAGLIAGLALGFYVEHRRLNRLHA